MPECSSCNVAKSKSCFTTSQLKKKTADGRNCKDCVAKRDAAGLHSMPVAVATAVADTKNDTSLKIDGETEAEIEPGETLDQIRQEIDRYYPQAKPNMRRWVIRIPASLSSDGSKGTKLEVWYGKWHIGDGHNKYSISGSDDEQFGSRLVEKRTEPESGYKRYWEVVGNCGVWDSQIGVMGKIERVPTFAKGPSTFIDKQYYPQLFEQIIIFTPHDIDVKWRIWRPDKTTNNALSV